ncbi:MAG: SDR family NAD(P)-dependent oxidoreductase [Deltaproteobacteria bacterium]|nr:MAG: SDR family NAD(P)-dependent oxidoreductase [Deltaproteobacteria bacterium]
MDTKQSSEPIAVIGMGCYYPGAKSPKQLWANVLSRRIQFRRIPRCRLSLEDYYNKNEKAADKTYARMAAVIDGFFFDWAAKLIPQSTYKATDIVHWLALETALQAIADAGFTESDFPNQRAGVIVGNTLTGEYTRSLNLRLRWPFVRKAFLAAARNCEISRKEIGQMESTFENYFKSVFPPTNEDTLAGGLSNTIAGRICNYLNCDGGGYTVDGACSSSLLAVATAAAGLSVGDLDLALAGGVDVSLDPFELIGFSKTNALSSGEMNVYDRRGSGFIPGEGCGFVVLKRYAEAIEDGNYIYATLHGWGISSDGGNVSITAPSVSGQALAIKRAYLNAGYGIASLDFIEGHGTGTVVGDRVELEALASVTSEKNPQQKNTSRHWGITSLKSIIGHSKAASGVGGFIKAVMAVNRRICPPTAGCRYPNRVFEETARSLYPIQLGKVFASSDKLRAGISAMGFGGINCHVTIESADSPSSKLEPDIDERSLMASAQENEIFVLNANNSSEMIAQAQELIDIADGISYAELTDLASEIGCKLQPGLELRSALLAGSPDELIERLQRLLFILRSQTTDYEDVYQNSTENIWIGKRLSRCRVGFLFSGQGSQKLNAARFLVERYRWARELVKISDKLSEEIGITPLSQIMYVPTDQAGDSTQLESWFTRLSQTSNAQPSICLASVLWYRFLCKLGVTPVAVGGHSLGEATAFYAAGAFDEATLLRFAFIRSQAMTLQQQNPGAMLSLQCSRQQLEALFPKISEGYVTLANINAPNQMVASVEVSAISHLSRLATEEGISVYRLPASDAFHSRLMLPAGKRLSEKLPLPSKILDLKTRLFSCIDGQEIHIGRDLRWHFIHQVTAQVDFVALVKSIAKCVDILVEVGPGRILTGLVNAFKKNGSPVCMPIESSPFQTGDLNVLLASLFVRGVSINWEVLYEKRLVNPFIPPSERHFFTNPCEQPLEIGINNQVGQSAHTVPLTDSMLPEVTGLTPETVRAYLKKRGTFLAEVIKADLKSSPHCNDQAGFENNMVYKVDTNIAVHQVDAHSNRPTAESIYDLIAETTGFPRETLTQEARLLDDLNLDSIKAGDLIARYAEQVGLSGKLDPADLTNASIGEIVDLVADLKSNQKTFVQKERKITVAKTLELLVELAARITGIPSVDISVDAPVGSDLQMEIDQLRQLMKQTSQALRLDGNIDLPPLLDRSLFQIAKILVRISRNDIQKELTSKVDLSSEWVRELKIELTETNRPNSPSGFGKRFEDQWPNALVLILNDNPNDQVCKAIKQRLTSSGADVHVRSYQQIESGELQDTMDFFSHFVAILPQTTKEVNLTEEHVKEVIHRLSLAAVPPSANSGPRRRTCLAFVQFGGGYFGTRPSSDAITQCCATALAKSVHLERKDLKTRVIDFSPKLEADVIAQKTVVEMEGSEDFSEAGYDEKLCRRTPSVCTMEPAEYEPDSTAWSETDVILVTGGAKGITAECAFALARETKVRMALVGRSFFKDSVAPNPEAEKIRKLLQRYEHEGLNARYYSCDVCDRNSLAKTVKQIQSDMGKITGVIHGAGLNIPRQINQVSADQALSEVAPKVIGALNLLDELSEDPPKLILGLTSIIGVTGMAGNSWYAFSNEALDLILRRYKAEHPGIRTLSVAYSIWRDEGMGARMGSVLLLKNMGIDAIPTEEGVKRFVRLFTHNPGTHQVIITARLAQFSTLKIQSPPFIKGARYLENLLHFTPGVESAFLAHLSLTEDLYLQDHRYNGSFLFPAVFGLEAMAQVVAHLTGITEFTRLRIEDLLLRRPITVDPDKGSDIIVWAQKQERHSFEDNL